MTRLVDYVFSPGGMAVVLLSCGIWLRARPGSRRAHRVLFAAGVFYVLASTFAVSYGVGRLLAIGVRPFQASDKPPGTTAIVVLGSGSFTARDWDERGFSIPDPVAAARVLEAARVFRVTEAAWIISSGGLVDSTALHAPSAETMAKGLEQLGVLASRVVVETTSRNTHEEAVTVVPMLRSLKVEHAILVTSDTHMRRSLGAFKAEGLDAIPAIARHSYANRPWRDWLIPTRGGLDESASVAHELLGIGYYVARGWYK